MTLTAEPADAGTVTLVGPTGALCTVGADDLLRLARDLVRADADRRADAGNGPVLPGGTTGAAVWFGHEIEDALRQERDRVLGAPGPVEAPMLRAERRRQVGYLAVQAAEDALNA